MLGEDVRTLRFTAFAAASIATAAAVATAGTVGFVGLIAPHLIRLLAGNDQRMLLPAAALAGGTLLLLADTVARTIAAPLQLPTGALMALAGAPLFLVLLWRRAHAA
jgi:iron complex transport system permease protein